MYNLKQGNMFDKDEVLTAFREQFADIWIGVRNYGIGYKNDRPFIFIDVSSRYYRKLRRKIPARFNALDVVVRIVRSSNFLSRHFF